MRLCKCKQIVFCFVVVLHLLSFVAFCQYFIKNLFFFFFFFCSSSSSFLSFFLVSFFFFSSSSCYAVEAACQSLCAMVDAPVARPAEVPLSAPAQPPRPLAAPLLPTPAAEHAPASPVPPPPDATPPDVAEGSEWTQVGRRRPAAKRPQRAPPATPSGPRTMYILRGCPGRSVASPMFFKYA